MFQRIVFLSVSSLHLIACGRVPVAPEPGPPASIHEARGDYQRADPGATLRSRLLIRLTDTADTPVPGVEIRWRFRSGAGQLDPARGRTDGEGQAGTTVHLSSTVVGLVEVEAVVVPDSSLRALFWVLIGDAALPRQPMDPDASIQVNDGSFSPLQVTIPVGGTVVWTLAGAQPHSIRHWAAGPRTRVREGTPNVTGRGSYIAVYPDSGDFRFFCAFHQNTPHGWVYVR